ncbi:MAG: hypothetical protein Q4G07_02680 [Oscillospiraceae bacterium]|nr:hypothetical protein [Oscillospiraceae bacterium]
MEGLFAILVVVGIVAVIYIFVTVAEKRNLKKAAEGIDKEKVERAVAAALPGEYGYKTLYAHWEERRRYGRTVETSYYHYAIAFKPDHFWVMPLHLNGENVTVSAPSHYSGEALGYIDIEPYRTRKKDQLVVLDTRLYDTPGCLYLTLSACSTEPKSDSSFFNLLQQEECDGFYETLRSLAAQVNPSHSFIEEGLSHKKGGQNRKKALTAALLAFFLSFIPIFSIPAACYSIYWALKVRQTGGRSTGILVLAAVGLLSSIGLIVVFVLSEMSLLL